MMFAVVCLFVVVGVQCVLVRVCLFVCVFVLRC